MERPLLTPRLVAQQSKRYVSTENGAPGSVEQQLFSPDGLRGDIAAQGYLTLQQLVKIVRWKSGGRTLRHFEGSEVDRDVRTISRLAVSDQAGGVRHRVLTLIKGVNRPTASAVLSIWRPDTYTVFDIRAVEALLRFGELDSYVDRSADNDPRKVMNLLSYNDYLGVCRGILQRLNADSATCLTLRDLDRALWLMGELN